MNIRDKIIVAGLGVCASVYVFYSFALVPTNTKISELSKEKSEVMALANDITPLLEQSEKLQSEKETLEIGVNDIKNTKGGYTATNEEFLLYLGESTAKNDVAVIGFNELGTVSNNGVYKAIFDFELKGNAAGINKTLSDIENIGIKCSVGSVSMRQNETYDYLKRFYDTMTKLPWYEEPDEEDKKNFKPEEETPEIPEIDLPSIFDEIILPEIIPEDTLIPEIEPTPEPAPAPADTPKPTPTPKEDETINDRLNDLLTNLSANDSFYQIRYIENESDYLSGQDMKLAVTVCLTMYNEPSKETSFYNHIKDEENAIL